MLSEQREHLRLRIRFALSAHWHVGEGHAEIGTQRFKHAVVGDHQRNLHRKFSAARTPEQIQQTVALLADEDGDPRQLIGKMQLRLTLKAFRQSRGCGRQRIPGDAEIIQVPLNPAQEESGT